MKNTPSSTIDIAAVGSKQNARNLFFSQGGATIQENGHRHVYSLETNNAQVTDMKMDESGNVIEASIQSKTVTQNEAFDLFWLMANKETPRKLLLATFSAICVDPNDITLSEGDEPSPAASNTL